MVGARTVGTPWTSERRRRSSTVSNQSVACGEVRRNRKRDCLENRLRGAVTISHVSSARIPLSRSSRMPAPLEWIRDRLALVSADPPGERALLSEGSARKPAEHDLVGAVCSDAEAAAEGLPVVLKGERASFAASAEDIDDATGWSRSRSRWMLAIAERQPPVSRMIASSRQLRKSRSWRFLGICLMNATGVLGPAGPGMCGGFTRAIGWCSISSSARSQLNHAPGSCCWRCRGWWQAIHRLAWLRFVSFGFARFQWN